VKVSLFALQVFLPLPAADSLRHDLVETVRRMPDQSGFAAKNDAYAHITRLLHAHVGGFTFGVWDYFEDNDVAKREWQQWCEGTEADAREAPAPDPYRAGAAQMFVTLLLLMAHGKAADRMMCEACRMPEGTEWTRQTFGRLLAVLPQLNFATVSSDAIYVRPGVMGGGVTAAELGEEHYQYLRKLT
jgi:hypothetical protein